MKLSLNWLKNYIDFPKNLDLKKFRHDLTMSTVEVEKITDLAENFNNIIVGKIIELKKHPNADKLQIVITDIGEKNPVQIVCGGTNLNEKMLVAVALPDAKVRWHGKGEPVVLEEATIRGEKSFGMICAAEEIGLENKFRHGEMEIIDLTSESKKTLTNAKVGQNLAKALKISDAIIDIDNKSLTHRPDLWNHYGMAREISAIYNLKLKNPELHKKPILGSTPKIKIKDKKACPRYIGCVIENIKVEPSPDWLIDALGAVGIRSINNIVDITNYVMLDIGEPMHAFDKDKADEIIVRHAKKNETITTLDNNKQKLDESMLVIADAKKPIALAGIMGGQKTGVAKKTTKIILESANFNGTLLRQTSQKLGLRTDSSIRFEKNLDVNLAEIAMLRAIKLIKEIIPKSKIKTINDINHSKSEILTIKTDQEYLNKKIGTKIPEEKVKKILLSLGFKVKSKNKKYQIQVPDWRATGDVSIPEDIVEEVARIYGYDNLEQPEQKIIFDKAIYQADHELENKIKHFLSVGAGMTEVFNYPWTEKRILDDLELPINEMIIISNPPAQKNKFLATTLIPNLIKNIETNIRYFSEFKIFELSRVFPIKETKKFGQDKISIQPKTLAGVIVSKETNQFLEIKGIIESLIRSLNCKNIKLDKEKTADYLNQNKSLIIKHQNEPIGWLGEINKNFKGKKAALFEIDFKSLIDSSDDEKIYIPLSQYPSIERDLAVETDYMVKWEKIKNTVKNTNDLIRKIKFLSEYNLPDKKSLAFRIEFRANERTLKDDEIDKIIKEIINKLQKKFNAKLRQ